MLKARIKAIVFVLGSILDISSYHRYDTMLRRDAIVAPRCINVFLSSIVIAVLYGVEQRRVTFGHFSF